METADLGLGDHLTEDCKLHNLPSTSHDKLSPDESVTTPSNGTACSRKRKVDHEEAIECCPAPLKRRFETRVLLNELEAEGGKILCWCSEWIPLRIGTKLSLEHWEKHFLTCQHLKAKGITSFEDIVCTMIEELHSPEIGTESSIEADIESLLPPVSVDAPARGTSEKEDMEWLDVGEDVIARDDNTYGEQDTTNGELKTGTEPRSPMLKRRRPNRTEAERVQDFLDDPQVRELEPYRVLCRTCNKWIKLRNNSRYCSIPWKCHKSSCKPNTTPRGSRHATPLAGTSKLAPLSTQGETASLNPLSPQPSVDLKVPPANMHPSLQINSLALERPPSTSKSATSSPKARRPRLTDAENRKAVLEADSNVETVEPHRVLCAVCKKWVKLRPNSTYCSAPWRSHIRRCLAKLEKKTLKALSSKKGTSRSGSGSAANLSEDESTLASPANRIIPKRRGRPTPKNQVEQQPVENNSESDRSYESEEE